MRTGLAVLRHHWERLGLVQARDFVLVAAVDGTAQARERYVKVCRGNRAEAGKIKGRHTHLDRKSLCIFVSCYLYYCCFNTIKITLGTQNQIRPTQ